MTYFFKRFDYDQEYFSFMKEGSLTANFIKIKSNYFSKILDLRVVAERLMYIVQLNLYLITS